MKFKGRQSDAWHKNISDTVGQRKPTDVDFPWIALQNHTGYYLKKKVKPSADKIDEYLLALIKKHPSKEVAIAACAHELSVPTIQNLLRNDFKADPDCAIPPQEYLQIIVAANHVNAGTVSDIEAHWARCLLDYPAAGEPSRALAQWFSKLLPLLPAWPTPNLLLQDDINRLASTVCMCVAKQLEDLRHNNQWSEAETSIGWLSTVSITNDSSQNHLLDTCLPAWRAWAAWRPHIPRLRTWKIHALCSHSSLGDLLALEGPDFVSMEGTEQATLRDGLTAQSSSGSQSMLQWDRSQVKFGRNPFRELENSNGILKRLMSVIDFACTASSDYKSLLAYLCSDNVISNEGLQTLESVRTLANPAFTRIILQALTAPEQNLRQEIQGIRQLLPSFKDLRMFGLRNQMQLYVTDRTTTYIRELQNTLIVQLDIGSPCLDTAMELLVFTLEIQEHKWLLLKLDRSIQQLIASGPSAMKTTRTLSAMRDFVKKVTTSTCTPLLSQINSYYKIWFMPGFAIDPNVPKLIETLINLWQQHSNKHLRELAVLIADLPLTSYQFRCDCLRDMTTFDSIWIMSALEALNLHDGNADLGCFALIKLLASESRRGILERWRKVLSFAIEKQSEALLRHALTHRNTTTWLELLSNIRAVYDESGMITQRRSPGLLCCELHIWSQQAAHYLPEMTHLESVLKNKSARHLLLLGNSYSKNNHLLRVLGHVKNDKSEFCGKLMDLIIELLSIANVEQVEDVLSIVSKASSDGAKACLRVLETMHHVSSGTAEVMLATSLRAGDNSVADRLALREVAGLFGITLDAEDYPSANGLRVAAEDLYKQYQNLMTEARRLENLRLSLQTVAPQRVSNLLVKLHIEAPSAADDALASLPPSLGSLIAKISKNELELQLPATKLTKLQRFAIGAGDTESFLVRLTLGHEGKPIKFCIHLSAESRHETDARAFKGKDHTSWEVFRGNRPPYEQYCHGRPNRGVYQLSRILWHHLRHNFVSLEQTYDYITSKLSKFGQGCMVCGRGQCQLRRATICPSPSCRTTFSQAHIEIQLAELWQDPSVMDLLLSMIHATTLTSKPDLLTLCSASDASGILGMLNSLPTIATLAQDLKMTLNVYGNEHCLSQTLATYRPESSDYALLGSLILWVCSSYHGFLISATGPQRIPSFGNNQFLVANMAPDFELAFSHHMPTPKTPSNILFHGTSLDRLHAILYQGLRVQTGTTLQRHGAQYGPGIYMADEPSVAWGYATASAGGWKSSKLKNVKVLLGCELAGSKPKAPSSGVYVITDPTRLAVRYIFLLQGTARMPAAKDVRLPMASVFQGLRNGTI